MGTKLSAVMSVIEHQSVLAPLQALEREGLVLSIVDVQPSGLIFPAAVSEAIQSDTALVSIQYINSEIGAVQPIKDIAKEIRRARTLREAHSNVPLYFHVDASQAPLWIDIKVESLGVDMLALDAQKILGPKGIGCLYVKRGVPLDPIVWGGGQERGKRAGTENAAAAASFAQALADAQSGVDKRAKKISKARDFLWDEIKKSFPNVVLHGPSLTGGEASRQAGLPSGETRVANNLNFSIPGLDAQMAVIAMDAEGIAISSRSACSTEDEEPSYVIKALGVNDKVAKEAIRITLLPDASYSDARRIAAALVDVASRYGKK